MRATVVLLLTIGLSAGPLAAQRKCTKGIPCGNTCIAANKVCRIGTTTARPASAPDSTARPALAAPAATPAPTTLHSLVDLPAGDSTWRWVAAKQGEVYYINAPACAFLQRVPSADRVYFRTELEAKAYGLRRSFNTGC
jgi:hypothetical protein